MTIFYHAVQLPLFATSRVCNTCGTEKSLVDEFEATPYGYRYKCKKCRIEQKKILNASRPAEEVAAHRHAFYLRRRDEGYRPPVHVLSEEQREQRKQKMRDRYANDPEWRAQQRQYQSRWISEHREQANEWQRQWKAAHPLKGCEYTMSYNARKKGASIVDDIDYIAILERDGLFCYICKQAIDINATGRASLAFDHVNPLKPRPGEPKGTHTPENLRPVHSCCNSRKHNKRFEEMTAFQRRGP